MKNKTGYRPSLPEAIKAKCCNCSGFYSDAKNTDCLITDCPLHPRMPYRKKPHNLSWIFQKWTTKFEIERKALGLTQEQYIKHHILKPNGKINISPVRMIRAKCYRCCNNFADGRYDCGITECSLYYWMPYRQSEPAFDWMFDSPHTSKHKVRITTEGLSRKEYLDKYFTYRNSESQQSTSIRYRKIINE